MAKKKAKSIEIKKLSLQKVEIMVKNFKKQYESDTPSLVAMRVFFKLPTNWKRDIMTNIDISREKTIIKIKRELEMLSRWIEMRILDEAFKLDKMGINRMKYWERAFSYDYNQVVDNTPQINISIPEIEKPKIEEFKC